MFLHLITTLWPQKTTQKTPLFAQPPSKTPAKTPKIPRSPTDIFFSAN
jgi:hypothetical protein